MSRAPARCRESDMMRALRVAEKMGGKVRVEVAPDGTIRFVPADGTSAKTTLAPKKRLML